MDDRLLKVLDFFDVYERNDDSSSFWNFLAKTVEKGWLAYYSKPMPPYHDQKHFRQRYDTALAKTH